MSTWKCRWINRAGRVACLLSASLIVSGCSAPNFFAKKDKDKSGKTDVAEESSTRPKEVKNLKKPIQFHLTYAKWKEEMGDMAEARQSYEIALGLEPNNSDAQLGLARIEWGTGQRESSERRFDKVLESNGHKPEVLDEVAQFYADQKRWPEAVDLLRRASELAPENNNYRFHYGIALANAGDLRSSYDQLTIVVSEPEAFYNIGHVLYTQGNVRDAEMHLTRALQLKPDMVEARNMIEEMHLAGARPIANPNFKQVSGTMTYEVQHEQPAITPRGAKPGLAPVTPAGAQPVQNLPGSAQTSPFYN